MNRRTKKRVLVVAIALVLLPGAALAAWALRTAQRERLLDRAREEGMAAYEAGDMPAALRSLGFYVGRRKDDGEILLAYAHAQELTPSLNDRNLVNAVSANRLAASVMPEDVRPLEALLRIYRRMGFAGETLATAEQALRLEPLNEEALRSRAAALFTLGRSEEAAQAAESTIATLGPRAWAFALLAEARLDANEGEQAIAWFTSYIEDNEANLDALLALARLQFAESMLEEGARSLERAASIAPQDESQLRNLLTVLDSAGLQELAAQALRSAPVSIAALVSVERAFKLGRFDAARESAEASMRSQQTPPTDLLAYAAMLAQTEASPMPEPAAFERLRAVGEPRRAAWEAILNGRERALAGAHTEALTRFREAASISSSLSQPASIPLVALHHLAGASAALGNHLEAVDAWRQLLSVDPAWRVARVALVEELLRVDRTQEALAEAVVLVQRGSDDPLAITTYLEATARSLESGSQPPIESRAALRQAMSALRSTASDNGELLALAARIHLASGEPDRAREAVAELEQAQSPASAPMLIRLAASAQRRAPDIYPRIAQLVRQQAPNSAALAFSQAIAAAREGSLRDGVRLLDDAIASASGPELLQLRRARAKFLQSVDQREAAQAMLLIADEHPGDVAAQTDYLSHPLAWTDQSGATRALARLGSLIGEDAALWRLYDAQRRISFERSDPNALGAALISLSGLIRAEPLWAEARLLAAEADLLLGDRAAAIETLVAYLDAGGRDARVYQRIVPLLREAGRFEDARAAVQQFAAVAMIPDSQLRARASLLEQWGLWESAIADLREASRLGDPTADAAIVRLSIQAGDLATAEEVAGELRAKGDLPLEAWEAIARLAAEQGDVEGALETLASVPDEAADADQRALAAALLLNSYGRREQAIEVLADRARQGDADAAVWARRAALQIDGLDFQGASRTAAEGLESHPTDPGLMLLRSLAELAQEADNPAAAIAGVNEALAASDARPEVRELGEILARHSRAETSRAEYVSALSSLTTRHPTLLPAWRPLVNAHLEDGRSLEAAATARAAAAALPSDPRILQLATQTLASTGQISEAIVFARAWTRIRPDDAAAALSLAELLAFSGQPREALTVLEPLREQVIGEADRQPAPLELFAMCLARAGRVDEAWDLLAARAQGGREWGRRLIVAAASLREDERQAREWLARAESIAAADPALLFALGEQWAILAQSSGSESDREQAIAFLERASEAEPSAAVHVALALAHEAAGDSGAAEASYREALRLTPDPIAMNNLAQLLASSGGSLSEARELSSNAIGIARRDGAPSELLALLIDTRASVELRDGQFEAARDAFREALSLRPDLPDSLVGLAEASLELGDNAAAEEAVARLNATGAPLTPAVESRLREVESRLLQLDTP